MSLALLAALSDKQKPLMDDPKPRILQVALSVPLKTVI